MSQLFMPDQDGNLVEVGEPDPALLAAIDQERAEIEVEMAGLIMFAVMDQVYRDVVPDDDEGALLNVQGFGHKMLSYNRAQLLGLIQVAVERLATEFVKAHGGIEATFKELHDELHQQDGECPFDTLHKEEAGG